MSRPARRSESPACSAFTLTVSRISRMRTCSSRERIQGSASSDSPFSTSGRHCAKGPFATATESMRSAVAVEQREEDRVGVGGLAQDVEALAYHCIGVAGGDVLEVDRNLGASEVDAERRAFGPRLPQLRRQDVGGRELRKRFAWHRSIPRWDPPVFEAVSRRLPRGP